MSRRVNALATARSLLRPRTRVRNYLAPRVRINTYVVIRFSLRYENYMRVAFKEESRRADWFAMRARLFRASVVASLARQTVPPRRVFVLMDVADADLWHQHLDLPAPYVPLFVAADEAFSEVSRRVAADGRRNVVLSRLDSDDAVSARYLEKIVGAARNSYQKGEPKAYVVASNGYFTDLSRVQEIYYNCSPFISLYLRRFRGENIFDGDHTRILERRPQLLDTVRWMQIIHGSNVDNRIYVKSKFEPEDERKMVVGEPASVKTAWPPGFPPKLLAEAKAVRDAWSKQSA